MAPAIVAERRMRPARAALPLALFLAAGTAQAFANDSTAELWEIGYVERYRMGSDFIATALKKVRANGGGFIESRIAFVLTTGANWAGPIKDFSLTVDKGAPDALVSFCGQGVNKTGPTTFETQKTDFTPQRDLNVLILSTPGR